MDTIKDKIYEIINLFLNYPYISSLTIPIIIVVSIWALERIFLNRDFKENFHSNNNFFGELFLWILHYTPIANVFAALSSFGLFNVLKYSLNEFTIPFIINLNYNLKVIILILLVDLTGYLGHVFLHKFKPFWNFHQFHHSANSFNVLTVHRVHFFEIAFIKLTQTSSLILLGGDLVVFWWYYIIGNIIGHLKHSNFVFNYPGIFKHIIQSPAHHWVHHSNKQTHYDKNFGETFQIWDTIFQTAYNPSKKEINKINLGTKDTNSFSRDLLKLFIYPYKEIFKKNKY